MSNGKMQNGWPSRKNNYSRLMTSREADKRDAKTEIEAEVSPEEPPEEFEYDDANFDCRFDGWHVWEGVNDDMRDWQGPQDVPCQICGEERWHANLYNRDPDCRGKEVVLWSGIKCDSCSGWYCA